MRVVQIASKQITQVQDGRCLSYGATFCSIKTINAITVSFQSDAAPRGAVQIRGASAAARPHPQHQEEDGRDGAARVHAQEGKTLTLKEILCLGIFGFVS